MTQTTPIIIPGIIIQQHENTDALRLTSPTTSDTNKPVVVMKRYELKYILSAGQLEYLKKSLEGYMHADSFGKTSIASLYYDTPDRYLIRTSVEKPEFKEKIRLRSYGLAKGNSPVYLELKRKAYGLVYKRRVKTTVSSVERFFENRDGLCQGGQINREIEAFRDRYENLEPSCLIIYDRTAFFQPEGDIRLTIDENPRYRTEDLRLDSSMEGTSLLPPDSAVLEIKVQNALPLWLTKILSEGKIYKTSFSKYGEAYRQELLKKRKAS